MRRQHPFISSIGLLLTALLLAGLGIMLWRTGGLAFSPGRLSAKSRAQVAYQGFASHADFEGECKRCHQPLQKSQSALCMECHDSIREQIQLKRGTHSTIRNVEACYACHTDHRGTEFDPTRAAYATFDHTRTRFSLAHHQVNYDASAMDCLSCHREDAEFSVPEAACAVCHASQDLAFVVRHSAEFGEDCTGCHDGGDQMVEFDHQATAFPLEGAHAQQPCTACHEPQAARSSGKALASFKGVATSCEQCHAQDNPHPGMFSADCAGCHNALAWLPASLEGAPFQHQAQSGFSLSLHPVKFDGSPLTCLDCHLEGAREIDTQSCTDCHSQGQERASFMATHLEEYGEGCIDCHDGVDRMQDFDHERAFPLDGKHAEVECLECHIDQKFSGTPVACAGCHAEPAIHAGFFGVNCQLCHTTQAWAPALLREHSFPLEHGKEGEQKCSTCHPSRYDEYTCTNCHEHEVGKTAEQHREEDIPLAELAACAKCHPTGEKEEE